MMVFDIPGRQAVTISHVVLDFNGTIAKDGILIPGVAEGIRDFSDRLTFHVITADTFGSVEKQLQGIPARLTRISDHDQARKKRDFITGLGAETCLCCGNGFNDRAMLENSALGIAVLGAEGLNTRALAAADLVINDILDLFGFLECPDRLRATLRD